MGKLNGNIVNFTGLKSKFESKVENWDRKAEAQDLKKVEDHMSNEVNKIKQDVDNIKSKNMDIENQFKNKSNEQTNTIAKDLENKLIENIKQIENRLLSFENSSKDTASKISDILQKNEKVEKDIISLSGFKYTLIQKLGLGIVRQILLTLRN